MNYQIMSFDEFFKLKWILFLRKTRETIVYCGTFCELISRNSLCDSNLFQNCALWDGRASTFAVKIILFMRFHEIFYKVIGKCKNFVKTYLSCRDFFLILKYRTRIACGKRRTVQSGITQNFREINASWFHEISFYTALCSVKINSCSNFICFDENYILFCKRYMYMNFCF